MTSPPTTRQIHVVGGGIVGLAVAWSLLKRAPDARITVLEKEAGVAKHQTGRNSGVLHSGLYYQPGSLKARMCMRGKALLEEFCITRRIPMALCGKVVVASSETEVPRLHALRAKAEANGVEHTLIDRSALHALEPHVRGVQALHVPEAGIVDYPAVCTALVDDLNSSGRGTVRLGARVRKISGDPTPNIWLAGVEDPLPSDLVINCAGLHSDRVARASGTQPTARIVPFRGEYFQLKKDAEHLVNNLVYPVPDPRFPFLGVHFTRMVGGGIECGPNAVFALAREGYGWSNISPRDMYDALSWPGTWRLFAKHWRTGLGETWRSFSKPAFVRALQKLVPAIRAEHLERLPAGVRAQALMRSGALLDDFAIQREGSVVHVLNAPSPAATASLAIAEHIVDSLADD